MFGPKSQSQHLAPIILMGVIATGAFGPMVQTHQPQPTTSYLSGVTPGTSVEYSAYLKSSSTGLTTMNYVQAVLVRYVSGPKVEYKQSFSYQNGTTSTPVVTYLTDVRDGSETKFFDTFVFPSNPRPQFFFASDLGVGDSILDPTVATPHFLSGLRVNGSKAVPYAGSVFESDFATAYLPKQGQNLSLYWEKGSGILLQFILSGGGYFLSLRAMHIDFPSDNAILEPAVMHSPEPGLRYHSMARVVIVGVKDISQEISFQAVKQGDTKYIQIPEIPSGYEYGFVQLFGVSSPPGITTDFHGFDKIVIGAGNNDSGITVNLALRATHKTADGRPIIDVVTRNVAPQLTILHVRMNPAVNQSDVRFKVYASLTIYKETYQEITGSTLRLLVPPAPDAKAFDSWRVYIMVGADSPLRVASVLLPNGTPANQGVAIVLPKTVILRGSGPSGVYGIKFDKGRTLPLAGVIRVDRTGLGEVPPIRPGWSYYFTAISGNSANHYYVADTSTTVGEEVMINASAGYFVGAVSGYAYIGLPDVALLKSGTFEREFLAILPPSGLASVKSLELPGTMYVDFYLDAKVPVSFIGRIEIVEGSSYLIQVAGLESGNRFGEYTAVMRWNAFNITVRSQDGNSDAGIPVRVSDLAGNELARVLTNSQGVAEVRVSNVGPFVTQIGTGHSALTANYFDSMNTLAGPLTVTLPSELPVSNPDSSPAKGVGLDAGQISASFPAVVGIIVVLLACILIKSSGQKSRLYIT